MILRDDLAKLLHNQIYGAIETWEDIADSRQEVFLHRADEIIKLFVDSIRNLDFKVS